MEQQQRQTDSPLKKEETVDTNLQKLPTLYEKELSRYRMLIERDCEQQDIQFNRFLSQKRCNQTKIVCKLLKYLLKLSELSDSFGDQESHNYILSQLSQMTQINDIRVLLADEKNTWFRNILKFYLLSPEILIPIIDALSKKNYVKYLLLYSFDVLHMMVDDPYRNYSTWVVSREVVKGDYSKLIESLQNGETLSFEYLRNYVKTVFELKGKDLLHGRKCSDTNNTCYFIVTFFIRFLKATIRDLRSPRIKKEQYYAQYDQFIPSVETLERNIKMLQRKKSFYSIKQLVNLNSRLFKNFIKKKFIDNNKFLIVVLSYERISCLTVKNIIEKYAELLAIFQD